MRLASMILGCKAKHPPDGEAVWPTGIGEDYPRPL